MMAILQETEASLHIWIQKDGKQIVKRREPIESKQSILTSMYQVGITTYAEKKIGGGVSVKKIDKVIIERAIKIWPKMEIYWN